MSVMLPHYRNPRFLFTNQLELATLTSVPSTVVEQPLSNLLHPGQYKVAQTNIGAVSWTITATWGAPTPLNLFCLSQHNLSAAAVVRVAFYNGNTLLHTHTVPTIYPNIVFHTYIGTDMEVTSLIITIQDSSNPFGFLRIGRMGAGLAFVPVKGAKPGVQFKWLDTGSVERAGSGAMVALPGFKAKQMDLSLDFLSKSERNMLSVMLRDIGFRGNWFLSLYPNDDDPVFENQHSGWWTINGDLPTITHDYVDYFSIGLSLTTSGIVVD